MKLLFLILSVLLLSCSTIEQEQRWSVMKIESIKPAWKGTNKMIVTWVDDQRVEHYEYTDTTGMKYYVGLKRMSLIKR